MSNTAATSANTATTASTGRIGRRHTAVARAMETTTNPPRAAGDSNTWFSGDSARSSWVGVGVTLGSAWSSWPAPPRSACSARSSWGEVAYSLCSAASAVTEEWASCPPTRSRLMPSTSSPAPSTSSNATPAARRRRVRDVGGGHVSRACSWADCVAAPPPAEAGHGHSPAAPPRYERYLRTGAVGAQDPSGPGLQVDERREEELLQ